MSVRFNIVYKAGIKQPRSDACFGRLNTFPLRLGHRGSEWGMTSDASAELRAIGPGDLTSDMVSHIEYLPTYALNHYVWSNPEGGPAYDHMLQDGEDRRERKYKLRCNKAYFAAVKEIVEDMPWWKGMLTVHPIQGVIRCHVKDNPADKMMSALFALRNLAQYDHGRTYLLFREQGYSPRVSLLMSLLYTDTTRAGMSTGNFTLLYLGENTVINPNTFGRNSAIAFLKAEEDEPSRAGWIQEPFAAQRQGYRRDHQLRADEVIFDPESAHVRVGEEVWDEEEDDYVNVGRNHYAKMVDVFSLLDDACLKGQVWSANERSFERSTRVPFDEIWEQTNTLITEAGI